MSKRKSHLYERNTREAIKRERKLRVACLKIKYPSASNPKLVNTES